MPLSRQSGGGGRIYVPLPCGRAIPRGVHGMAVSD